MPKALELKGQRFGKLTVMKRAGKVQYGHLVSAWEVRCDCGKVETYPQTRLPISPSSRLRSSTVVYECSLCRRQECFVCGKPVDNKRRNTCSEECNKIKRNAIHRKSYKKRITIDPDLNIKNHKRANDRLKKNPTKLEQLKKLQKQRLQKHKILIKENKEYRENYNKKRREYYAKNKEKISSSRERIFKGLSDDEKVRRKEQANESQRKWRQKWRDNVYSDPILLKEYREIQKKGLKKKALNEMLKEMTELIERSEHDTDKI